MSEKRSKIKESMIQNTPRRAFFNSLKSAVYAHFPTVGARSHNVEVVEQVDLSVTLKPHKRKHIPPANHLLIHHPVARGF